VRERVGSVRDDGVVPITLVTGPANSGKAEAVLQALRGHHARGEDPLLVVPTRADVEHYRQELAHGGLVLGVRVERFHGLDAEVLRRSGSPGRALGRIARERVLAAVARRAHPERARPAPGLVRALGAFVAELEAERVTPARLHQALGAWAAAAPAHAPRARELGALYEDYRHTLERLGREDRERRTARALDVLRRDPAMWGSTPLLLYGFDDFTAPQLDTIEALGAVVGAPVTVSLAYEPGRTAFAGRAGTFHALLPLAAEHRALPARATHYAPCARAALHQLERHLFEPALASPVDPGAAVKLLAGANERAELELIAREIAGLLERGVPPEQIAVAHRSPATVAELLGEVFRAHRVPFTLERRMPFAHTPIGRGLLGLLAAALGEDGRGDRHEARLEDLLAWLRVPGLLHRPELADRLEARARRAGIADATRARALWEAEHWPLQPLDRLREAAARGPMALIECTARELERLFCAPRLGVAAVLTPQELPDARALALARGTLDELRELARANPELAPDAGELIALLRGL
jgi:ATP-dependent helicase/DNAse subunit B